MKNENKTKAELLKELEILREEREKGVFKDITKIKKAEQVIQESESRFRELFKYIRSGVVIYEAKNNGRDFIIKDFNRAAEKIDKVKKEDIIGESVLKIFPGVKDFGLFKVFQEVYKTGKPQHYPISLYKDQRITGWRENHVYKLPSGEIAAVYDDITARKQAEEELKKERVNMTNLIEQVASSFKQKIKKKGLKLKMSLPKEEIVVYAEGDKIIEVFTNLLGNALKFTEKGYIEVSAKELEDTIECVVSDTGIGISKNDRSKLFNKFQQIGRIDSGGEKGTGLGLSITKGIVEAHHGKIWAKSSPDIGSKFIFILPKYVDNKILFHECINNGIRESIKKNSKMSLITVSIFELNKLKQKLSLQTLDSSLKDIEEILRNNNCRTGDVVVRENNENIVLLNNCDKKNASKVEDRIKKMLDDYLKDHNLTKEIKLILGCATYPDDGLYAEKLLKIAAKGE